eukprot:15468611-Alexandrium_andersonii.AAC.1
MHWRRHVFFGIVARSGGGLRRGGSAAFSVLGGCLHPGPWGPAGAPRPARRGCGPLHLRETWRGRVRSWVTEFSQLFLAQACSTSTGS